MFMNYSFTADRYVTPVCETLDVKVEGCLCGSENDVRANSASSGYGVGDNYNLGEI